MDGQHRDIKPLVSSFSYLIYHSFPEKPEERLSLPWAIGGECSFKLQYDSTPGNTMKSTQDGRPWKRYNKCYTETFNSSQGKRLRATCKGCHECPNDNCIFKRQYKKRNRFQFIKSMEGLRCKECGSIATPIKCDAVKVWEFPNKDPGHVYVYHTGIHNCVASKTPQVASTTLTETLQKKTKLKPQEAANLLMIQAIRDDARREELDDLAFNLIDSNQLRNLKQKKRQQTNPCGKFVDQLIRLKNKGEIDFGRQVLSL